MRYFSDPNQSWANVMMFNAGIAGFLFQRPALKNRRGRQEGKWWKNLSSRMISKEAFVLFFMAALGNQRHFRFLPTPEMLSLAISSSPSLWSGFREAFCSSEIHILIFSQTTLTHAFLSSFSPETPTLMQGLHMEV